MHPAERFSAPSSIQTGTPLKQLLDGNLAALIAESIHAVYPKLDTQRFIRLATDGLEHREFKQRADLMADALAAELPEDFDQTADLLIASLGPKLDATSDNGLAPFFYLPHSQLIARYAATHFESGMRVNYELTQRFTAEFSIRPYIVHHPAETLERLARWTADANPHVRRLVSEGSRPRLPWAMRLSAIQADPRLTLPLLEKLKDDPELYVRRSVANHLGDLAKDRLELILELCETWLAESHSLEHPAAKNRRWIIRHALRHPAKKGHPASSQLRKRAA